MIIRVLPIPTLFICNWLKGLPWDDIPREITGIKVGIVGLGKSGGMIADALKFFGADVAYFARSEKEAARRRYRRSRDCRLRAIS